MRYCNFMLDFQKPDTGLWFHYMVPQFKDLHTHNYFELFLITQGELIHHINNHKYLIKKGSINFIRPTDQHEFLQVGSSNVSPMLVNVMIVPQQAEKIFNAINPNLYSAVVSSPNHISHQLTDEEFDSFYKMLEHYLFKGDQEQQETIIRLYLCEFIKIYFMKHYSQVRNDGLNNGKRYDARLKGILAAMRDSNNFELSFDELVADIPYSRVHINRIFKQSLGCTPIEYFINIKMDYARNLLISSNLTILEISSKIGYSSLSYFSNLFKKLYGYTPKEYRNKYGIFIKSECGSAG